jgi:hypothetical protein
MGRRQTKTMEIADASAEAISAVQIVYLATHSVRRPGFVVAASATLGDTPLHGLGKFFAMALDALVLTPQRVFAWRKSSSLTVWQWFPCCLP